MAPVITGPVQLRGWALLTLIAAGLAGRAAGAAPDFSKDIAPILESRCLACHNAAKARGDLILETAQSASDHKDLLDAAHPEASLLLKMVSGDAPAMPKSGPKLTTKEVATLRAWIAAGARWPETTPKLIPRTNASKDWWSLRPLVKPAVPDIRNSKGELANPIDAFIRAKLAGHGLVSAPPAGRRTLIRRLYFDLIGLPPTPERIEAFVRDPDPRAYEQLVDELLASPRHGERWARHWLDVVHYGDTHGYDKDKPRPNAWPYRDYVIRAFNEDKPWARFVEEQVAGDVLHPGTVDGIEALGFIAAGPWDYVGHAEVPETKIDGKIARHLDRDDMVANTIQSFNSLTVGCAQCHDHKFDPIPQADYYRLHAVFAAVDRADKQYFADAGLTRRFHELEARRRELGVRKQSLDDRLRKLAGPALAELDSQIAAATKAGRGNTRPEFGYHSAIASRPDLTKWVQVDLGRTVNIERVVLQPCHDDFNHIGAGFGFPVRFKIETSDDAEFKSGVKLLWRKHDQTFMNDFPNPGLRQFVSHVKDDDGTAGRYVRVTATKLAPRKNDFIFALAELQVLDARGTNVAAGTAVAALDSIEAPPRWRKVNLVDGIAPDGGTPDDLEALKQRRMTLLANAGDEATRAQLAAVVRELGALDAELARFPKPGLVYAGTVHLGSGSFAGRGALEGRPRTIHLLHRGDVRNPGPEMGPGTLSIFDTLASRFDLPANHPEGDRRAALAKWLSSPANALTWRSIVNRVWQHHFGRGFVETPNDFGRNGGQPSHPELLDWLAVTFRDDLRGSLKALHKLIVTSATYRQSSVGTDVRRLTSTSIEIRKAKAKGDQSLLTSAPTAESIDAGNTLLWRMNRRKLEAEAIRDSVLFVSGKLDLRMGGPAFQDFVIEKPQHSPHYQYHLHDPDDPRTHRRSVYRFIVRSQLQPFMNTLDCADPSIQVARRNESLSPLQALAMLNNGLMVAMAKHLGAKLEQTAGGLEGKVRAGFQQAIGRTPSPDELHPLTAYAREFGLANYGRLLFNLNEFSFVD